MARLAASGTVAVLRGAPDGCAAAPAPGTVGILEVWESERSHPGRLGAAFYYPLELDGDGGALTRRFLRTTLTYELEESGGTVALAKAGSGEESRRYVFELPDGKRLRWLSHGGGADAVTEVPR